MSTRTTGYIFWILLTALAGCGKEAPVLDPRTASHLRVARAYLIEGRYEEARDEYRAALSSSPGLARVHSILGFMAARGERYPDAEAAYVRAITLDPKNAAAHNDLGCVYVRLGKMTMAADAFARAIERAPQEPLSYHNLGLIETHQGHYDRAEELFRKAIDAAPEYAMAYSGLADLYLRQDAPERARGAAIRAIELRPEDAEAQYYLGQSCAKLGEDERAIAHYRTALELAPHYKDAFYGLALAYRRQGRRSESDRAMASFRELASRTKGTEADQIYFSNAAELSPPYAQALACLDGGQYDEAITAYQRGLRSDPDSAMARSHLAWAYLRAGRYDRALEEYSRALALAPDLEVARTGRAALYGGKRMWDEVLQEYHRVLEGAPGSAAATRAHVGIGEILMARGQKDAALSHYQEAIRIAPDAERARAAGHALAEHYLMVGMYEEAAKQLESLAASDPMDRNTQMQLGLAYSRMGAGEQARAHYRRAVGTDSVGIAAYCGLGDLHCQSGRPDSAIAYYEKALTLRPTPEMSARIHTAMGDVCAGSGSLDRALERYRAALDASPENGDARLRLARIYYRKGMLDPASGEYRKLLKKPEDAPLEAWMGIALIYQKQGRRMDTRAHYRQALVYHPNAAVLHNGLADLYREDGVLDSASAEYTRAIALAPRSKWAATAHAHLAGLCESQGQRGEAIAHLEAALSLSPGWAPGYGRLAWLYAEENRDLDRAVDLARRAVRQRDDPMASGALAFAYFRKGMYAEAEGEIRRALVLAPADRRYTDLLARIQEAKAGEEPR